MMNTISVSSFRLHFSRLKYIQESQHALGRGKAIIYVGNSYIDVISGGMGGGGRGWGMGGGVCGGWGGGYLSTKIHLNV
jgi:hypothetical protein